MGLQVCGGQEKWYPVTEANIVTFVEGGGGWKVVTFVEGEGGGWKVVTFVEGGL